MAASTTQLRIMATGITVASLAITLLVAELVMRRIHPLPPPLRAPQVRYDPHPTRQFTLRPAQEAYTYSSPVSVDADGFRVTGGPVPDEPDLRVVGLGDSFTFGMGIADSETWVARLVGELREQGGLQAQVLNAGTISYGVWQEMDLMRERVLEFAPDVVIHGLYWNDHMSGLADPDAPPALTPDGYFVWDVQPISSDLIRTAMSWASERSALVNLGKRVAKAALGRDHTVGATDYERMYQAFVSGVVDTTGLAVVEAFYRELLALGRERGFEVYVIVFPVVDVVVDGAGAQHPYPVAIRSMLEGLGIRHVDAFTLWQDGALGRETFLPQNRHLNASGYRVIAAAAARMVLRARPSRGPP